MARREFSLKTKREALKRAGGKCEGILSSGIRCDWMLDQGVEIDHVIADQLGGKPDLSNAQCLCPRCHKDKTARDARLIAKAKHRADAHAGITAPKRPIQSAPMPRAAKQRRATAPVAKLAGLPRRSFKLFAREDRP